MHTSDAYVLWLSRIDGLGCKKVLALIEHFPDISDVFTAGRDKLKQADILTEANVEAIVSSRDEQLLTGYISELESAGIGLITINNPKYPALLKEIYDPPVCLYVLGELPDDCFPKISIIGSRRCSEYGLTVARTLGYKLAACDITVVSGMAKGIDASAHRGALEANGKTAAVLGCGVDICYPSENERLRNEIIKNGCLISEFPPKTKPLPQYFPLRNRIISGLSMGTVVVEAAEKSGTLITVGQALDQGREVFAIPGNITSKLSRGTNSLIKQGAALTESYIDILDALGLPDKTASNETDETKPYSGIQLKPDERLVYDAIGRDPVSQTDIMLQSKSQAHTVQYILTMLEINGYIQKLPGQRYIRR